VCVCVLTHNVVVWWWRTLVCIHNAPSWNNGSQISYRFI